MRARTSLATTVLLTTATLVLAGCGSNSTSAASMSGKPARPPSVAMAEKLDKLEGSLNLIAWAGYAESGKNDPKVDWVTPFENDTGCKVNVKVGNTSDEMVTMMRTGEYDGVSASGDATLRLIYAGDVTPVNTALVPNYATISSFLKNRPWNSVDGQMYGIPHGWGANLLMWNTATVNPAPDSWGSVFDPNSPYKGKVTAYDSPIYIADAALYLKSAKPDLKITNPYELTDQQFKAATDLLKTQKTVVGEYWSDYTKAVTAFDGGNSVLGTTWQVIANSISKVKVATLLPKEGSTGWSDTWMVSSKAQHPNCMYKWMDWIVSPAVNAQVAEYFGEAPAQTLACDKTKDQGFCKTFHATDRAYADKISYWTTPSRDCGDDRGVVCKDYAAWTQAWTAIKG